MDNGYVKLAVSLALTIATGTVGYFIKDYMSAQREDMEVIKQLAISSDKRLTLVEDRLLDKTDIVTRITILEKDANYIESAVDEIRQYWVNYNNEVKAIKSR